MKSLFIFRHLAARDWLARHRDKISLIAAGLLISGMVVYVLLRAFFISFSHDEAFSCLYYSTRSFADILTFEGPVVSSNHLLNSLLMKCLLPLAGLGEFGLRLPSLAGFGIFLTGVYRTLVLFQKREGIFWGLCVMLLHPFMLDFFSLARGYALALGFLSWGIYFLFLSLRDVETPAFGRHMRRAYLMLTVATLAHLTYLDVLLSMAGVFLIAESYRARKLFENGATKRAAFTAFCKEYAPPLLTAFLVLFMVYAVPVLKMIKMDPFFGGEEGFWKSTVWSLVKALCYGRAGSPAGVMAVYLSVVVVCLASAGFVLGLLKSRRRWRIIDRYFTGILGLLVFCGIIICLQWFFLKTPFILERRALFFIPLFSLLIILLWEQGNASSLRVQRFARVAGGMLVVILIWHFARSANMSAFYLWRYDAATKRVMQKIVKLNQGRDLPAGSSTIGIHWPLEPSVNFYKLKYGLIWLQTAGRSGPHGRHDYYYLLEEDSFAFREYVQDKFDFMEAGLIQREYGLKVLERYPWAQAFLAVPTRK